MKNEHISLSGKDKIALIGNMATMLSAGISILETVDSLLEDSKGNQKRLLEALREDLVQGKHVYASFARFPNIFDKVTTNIIKASEEAGTLDVTLRDLQKNIRKEMEFTDKIRSALIYPIMISLVFGVVLLTILVVVVPKISSVFTQMQVELPLPTRVMIFASNLLLTYTIPLIAGIVAFIIIMIALYKKNRMVVLNVLFGLPLVSQLIKEIDITRFARSMSLLLSSGIPVTGALELTQDVVMRTDISQMVRRTQEMVLSGKRISEGLRSGHGLVPMIMIKIIEAGEKTGSLDKSMQEVSEYLDYQVTRTLQTLTVLLEPIMLIFIGVAVGGMMLAIIAPIYGLIGQVGSR